MVITFDWMRERHAAIEKTGEPRDMLEPAGAAHNVELNSERVRTNP